MFLFEWVFLTAGIRIAPLPELADKVVALLIRCKFQKRFFFLQH